MDEYLGKVKLNYDFYKGEDLYSDGPIEDELLEIVKNEEDLEEYLTTRDEWPILYHLSKIRHNLLEWYDFGQDKSVLEIGAGCGAISGLLCEKCSRVVAIDLSKRRSLINANRNNYDNLEIVVGNFEDIKIKEKFDYVTLIGVLEYSIYYMNSEEPFIDMLRAAKSYLKKGGKIIIAIENKYGIKYWAGAHEDHTGNMYDGITDYQNIDKVRTFSKKKLQEFLKIAGFKSAKFYYPVPDYKMPLEIYSDDRLPGMGDIDQNSPAYDKDRYLMFDETKALNGLSKENMFDYFSNSFLVFANK